MKTIGVLGGISAQATMDFEPRLHAVAQRRIPQRANSGYPPLVVYYHRGAPILVDDQGRVPRSEDSCLVRLQAPKRSGAGRRCVGRDDPRPEELRDLGALRSARPPADDAPVPHEPVAPSRLHSPLLTLPRC